jgi:hypothetical protein
MSPAKKRSTSDEGHLVDFDSEVENMDPSVRALINQSDRMRGEARLTRRERDKRIKERRKIRARRAQHTCYDIPPELRRFVKELSEELRLPASQLATLALLRFVQDYQNGEIDLSSYKTPSRSPRFDWNLAINLEDFGLKKD